MPRRRRKIIVFVATSADGYIARPDGDIEWLNRRPHDIDYGMHAFVKGVDTVLWGRKTYDWVRAYYAAHAVPGSPFDASKTHYVFSHTPPADPAPEVTFVTAPIRDFAQRLRATPGRDIWMMGGAGLIASFLDAGEVDEFDINVIPTLIGEGIPLVAPRHRDIELRTLSVRKFADGVVRMRYAVGAPPAEVRYTRTPRARSSAG